MTSAVSAVRRCENFGSSALLVRSSADTAICAKPPFSDTKAMMVVMNWPLGRGAYRHSGYCCLLDERDEVSAASRPTDVSERDYRRRQ
jgi:hypothetical protein